MKDVKKKRPKVKFCGMTRQEDIELACELGVDAIGMILVPGTGRGLDIQRAKQLRGCVPSDITLVTVVRNPDEDYLRQVIAEVQPDVIQFHGDETLDYCEQFQLPFWKAIAVKDSASARFGAENYAQAQAIVFDSWSSGGSGGHGVGFDWSLLPASLKKPSQPFVLSGGLNPDVVAQAQKLVADGTIDMLDVSTGIEYVGGVKGIKSAQRMKAFMDGILGVQISL